MQTVNLLDLSILLMPPGPKAAPETLASITLRCDQLDLIHTGQLLSDPLTPAERDSLRWYLEEYWKWPYMEFAVRGKQVESLLIEVGRRLYDAVFGNPEAQKILQTWQQQTEIQRQISIVSEIPPVLSLPWELLHDEQDFLALHHDQGNVVVRRLPQAEHELLSTPFEPPLRVLLVTSRPEGEGFIDPRTIANELLDEMRTQVESGTIELEFLRPPTFPRLRARLCDPERPRIHVLHFDGHGTFDEQVHKQGMLLFETEAGGPSSVRASDLAKILQEGQVRLAVLTACQSAVSSEDDALSSVASHLIRAGVDAVVAMSANVLVATAVRYSEVFYRGLGAGVPVLMAQKAARKALHDDPHRHLHYRHQNEQGMPVKIDDWWLPHFYQQRPLVLEPGHEKGKTKLSFRPLQLELLTEPRFGFYGRARELLQIERWLRRGKLVVIHGFAGVGKTALAREAARWFVDTKMYDNACFYSFDHGGDAGKLLSVLHERLEGNGSSVVQDDLEGALGLVRQALFKEHQILVIVDGLDYILPGGDFPLEKAARHRLWKVLLDLAQMGAAVLLTSQDISIQDEGLASGNRVAYLRLEGLHPGPAYLLATQILTIFGIDSKQVPYPDMHDLLKRLDYHPLAIQLVLPLLRQLPLSTITDDFDTLFPTFVDETETGRNRSLHDSVASSFRRLSNEQQSSLARFTPFEGGTLEVNILEITGISKNEWSTLRPALERSGLLLELPVHSALAVPFLSFHPMLAPFLRNQFGRGDDALRERYARRYLSFISDLAGDDNYHPQPVRALVLQELPNLRRAMELFIGEGNWEDASRMTDYLSQFLTTLGLERERSELRRRVVAMMATAGTQTDGELNLVDYLLETGLAGDELARGKVRSAAARYQTILKRLEALPEGAPLGIGSHEHRETLRLLATCLSQDGQATTAEKVLRKALVIIEALLKERPADQSLIGERATFLLPLGNALLVQGRYPLAREVYEEVFSVSQAQENWDGLVAASFQLGLLAQLQGEFNEAETRYIQCLIIDHQCHDATKIAITWHQLGMCAQEQENWEATERYYRKSLEIKELLEDAAGASMTCNQLSHVARALNHFTEAEGWLKQALKFDEQVHPDSILHAGHLMNLASLLTKEVQMGLISREHLAEARRFAEQALEITSEHEDLQRHGGILHNLAIIADLEGRRGEAMEYRRRAQIILATRPGNRFQLYRQLGPLLSALAATATGNPKMYREVGKYLSEMNKHLADALQRILRGERNFKLLVQGVGDDGIMIVAHTLRMINFYHHVLKRIYTSLPLSIRDARQQGDTSTSESAVFAALSSHEQRAVRIADMTVPLLESGEFWPLLHGIADVASGYPAAREAIEKALGAGRENFREAVHRIWLGERNGEELTAELDLMGATLLLLVLDILAEQEQPEEPDAIEKFEPLLQAIAKIAAGERGLQTIVEKELDNLELQNCHIKDAIQLIWKGERERETLTRGLTKLERGLVDRVLLLIAENQIEALVGLIIAVAKGDKAKRGAVEAILVNNEPFKAAVQQLWAGERRMRILTQGLTKQDAFLLYRVLELMQKG